MPHYSNATRRTFKPPYTKPVLETELLRKYIATARTITPEISKETENVFVNYYVRIRSQGAENKSTPITARQIEGLLRLAEAYAKIRLSDTTNEEDALNAVSMMEHCYKLIATDPETGLIDVQRIDQGITSSERNRVAKIQNIINTLIATHGKTLPIEDILERAAQKDINEEQASSAIEKLKRSGDLFEPKPGLYSEGVIYTSSIYITSHPKKDFSRMTMHPS